MTRAGSATGPVVLQALRCGGYAGRGGAASTVALALLGLGHY
ncbi:MAG TPA: hypothetical protein VFG15_16675 [Amycolatopsis sp.]|nr:hypothetical protein [Amycolatopsis sp.]